jgi:DNA mismatch repair protein MutS
MADSTPMMLQYERIKAEHGDTILFFRLGDFYEMFRQDALDASRLLSLTLTQRNGTPMCGVPHHAARTYIPRLLAAGRKVAICEQVTEPQAGKGLVERQVTSIITPGTLLEDEFLEQGNHNFLLSVAALGGVPVDGVPGLSVALFDMSTGDLLVQSAAGTASLSLMETLLAKWQPRELVVQENLVHGHEGLAKTLHDHPELLANRFGDWQYDIKAAEAQLCRLIGVLSLKSFGLEPGDPRLQAVAAVLNYCEHTAKHQLDHIRAVRVISQGESLELDETSVKNLELVRNLHDNTRSFSLLEAIDQTRTPMGARLLRLWVLQPLKERRAIDARLDAIEWLYHRQDRLNDLRDRLRSIADVQRLANRVVLDKAHPKDIMALAVALERMAGVRECLDEGGEANPLGPLFATVDMAAVKGAAAHIRASLLDEPSLLLTEGSIIRDGADAKVDEYRRLKGDSHSILEAYVEQEKAATGIAGLRVRHNNIIGFYLEVTKSNLAAVPGHFLRKQSLVNGERYTTARLTELEEAISHASELCVERERELFLALRQGLKPLLGQFHALAAAVGQADVFAGLAHVATARGYTRPRLADDRRLSIRGGRHPVVENYVGQGRFIPNDIELSTAGRPATTALITGPNMAGKSTFLRQTALIALLAHIGSFVPADEAEIGPIDRIFCRVGASDNLARGESTFLVEMNETALILRAATADSLVIMDEVGRGTSTQDGLSIAQAILEYLLGHTRCRCLFATHFHELTDVPAAGMENLSMAVDESGGTITFLKKVQPGPSNNSYGIHVARLAGIPEPVILRAQLLLDGLPSGFRPPASSVPGGRSAKPVSQASLFSPSDQIETALRNFSVDRSTPLEALNAIAAWKKLLES